MGVVFAIFQIQDKKCEMLFHPTITRNKRSRKVRKVRLKSLSSDGPWLKEHLINKLRTPVSGQARWVFSHWTSRLSFACFRVGQNHG